MRIIYSCCRACSEPVPAAFVCVCVCVCIPVPEHPSAPLLAACLLNVTHAASPLKPASSPNPVLRILKNSLTSGRCPSFCVISSECLVPCVLSTVISLSQVQTKLNLRQITGRLWSSSIQESRQLLNLSDSLSFLTSIPEQACAFFFSLPYCNLFFLPEPLLILCNANEFIAHFWQLSTSGQEEKVLQIYKHSYDLIYEYDCHFFFLGTCVGTYPTRVLHPCPAALLPKAMTLLPLPRCQPVEIHL